MAAHTKNRSPGPAAPAIGWEEESVGGSARDEAPTAAGSVGGAARRSTEANLLARLVARVGGGAEGDLGATGFDDVVARVGDRAGRGRPHAIRKPDRRAGEQDERHQAGGEAACLAVENERLVLRLDRGRHRGSPSDVSPGDLRADVILGERELPAIGHLTYRNRRGGSISRQSVPCLPYGRRHPGQQLGPSPWLPCARSPWLAAWTPGTRQYASAIPCIGPPVRPAKAFGRCCATSRRSASTVRHATSGSTTKDARSSRSSRAKRRCHPIPPGP